MYVQINIIVYICLAIIWLKALTVGSEFRLDYWFKYRKKYTDWYNNREQFNPEK